MRDSMTAALRVGIVILGTMWAAPVAGQSGVTPARGTAPAPLEAGSPQDQADRRVVLAGDENARETRDRLQRMLNQYPTTLGEVLRRDPTLLRNDAYLVPYPGLAAFLSQHPEVAHNPVYFLGSPQRDTYADSNPGSQKVNAIRSMFESFTVLMGFVSFFAMIAWVTKSVIDQRRWARVTKAQTEAHAKVIDRLNSNEELLAYIQTPAGQRYLASTSLMPEGREGPVGAPYSRILWSIQAGTVASLVGLGFLFVSSRWAMDTEWLADFSRMLFLGGVVVLATGIGFVLSGVVSYTLSRRFGLIQSPNSTHA